MFIIWKHLNLPDPTPVQYDIARYIQESPKRCIIQAFRGVGKSYITATYVLWVLLRNPNYKIMVVSATQERAINFSVFVKKLINEVPILRHLKASMDQRNSNLAFDVAPCTPDQSPSVKSCGITGQLTGSRADFIIADDIETPGNSATQVMRDKITELVKEFDSVLKPLETSKIIYLGTPQQEMSLYNLLVDERGYECRIWPALYPTKDKLSNYKDRLAPMIMERILSDKDNKLQGLPCDPIRFSSNDLEERLLSYGRSGFALQFMLDTTLSDADKYPLKISDLIMLSLDKEHAPTKIVWGKSNSNIINTLPNLALTGDKFYAPMYVSNKLDEYSEYEGVVMSIDPSGRGKDETGYAVVKQLAGYLFVSACGGIGLSYGEGYSTRVLQELAYIAKSNNVNYILVESNFGDGMFSRLLNPVLQEIYPCSIEEIRSSKSKEQRIIEILEPLMNNHRLVVDPDVITKDYSSAKEAKYSLVYQMTRLTKERGSLIHDDRLDALALACNYWLEAMKKNTDMCHKSIKQQYLDDVFDAFVNNQVACKLSVIHKDTQSNNIDTIYRTNSWLSELPE